MKRNLQLFFCHLLFIFVSVNSVRADVTEDEVFEMLRERTKQYRNRNTSRDRHVFVEIDDIDIDKTRYLVENFNHLSSERRHSALSLILFLAPGHRDANMKKFVSLYYKTIDFSKPIEWISTSSLGIPGCYEIRNIIEALAVSRDPLCKGFYENMMTCVGFSGLRPRFADLSMKGIFAMAIALSGDSDQNKLLNKLLEDPKTSEEEVESILAGKAYSVRPTEEIKYLKELRKADHVNPSDVDAVINRLEGELKGGLPPNKLASLAVEQEK